MGSEMVDDWLRWNTAHGKELEEMISCTRVSVRLGGSQGLVPDFVHIDRRVRVPETGAVRQRDEMVVRILDPEADFPDLPTL